MGKFMKERNICLWAGNLISNLAQIRLLPTDAHSQSGFKKTGL